MKNERNIRAIFQPPVSQPTAPADLELNADDVVISGIAGQVPNCANLREYKESLFNKKELLTPTRDVYGVDHSELPPCTGKIPGWSKFDADFFGFCQQEAEEQLDPQIARLLENSYGAIMDAGIHPSSLRGQKIAVVTAAALSDSDSEFLYNTHESNQERRFLAGKHTYGETVASLLGLKGPCYLVDTACSSSLYALTKAWEIMKREECDSALVCCTNLLYSHVITLQFARLGVLSRTPHCSPMDVSGDGYVRSEGLGAILLQRARAAKRAYAVVVHAECNADGFKEESITYPSRIAQAKLLRSVYSKPHIDALSLTYMELHGTGTIVGDPVEIGAIEDVLFEERRRETPLLIGSNKSNLGHSEGSSGFCSLAKILIMMQTGYIPPTINFSKPRKNIAALFNGRMQVVTETQPWQPGLVAINNFGFGGANAHVILRPGPRRGVKGGPSALANAAPRLVLASGRTEEAALALVQLAASGGASVDAELVRLLHDLSATATPGHAYRVFALAPAKSAPAVRRCGDARPTVQLALAEAGAWADGWASVGAMLQRLPAFAIAFRRQDSSLPVASAVQEALLSVLRATGVMAERAVAVRAKGAMAMKSKGMPVNGIVLLVAPPGEALRTTWMALRTMGTNGGEESIVALLGAAENADPLLQLLCSLGRLYCLGVDLNAAALYEEVPLPVTVETPMISPEVLWDHSKVRLKTHYVTPNIFKGVAVHPIALTSVQDEYMKGHVLDGRNLMPATGYIDLVWKTFVDSLFLDKYMTSVVFEDLQFLRATHFPKDFGAVNLRVTIHRETGAFEVAEGTTAVVTGYVRLMTDEDRTQILRPAEPWDPCAADASPHMTPRDVYKALRLRGYNYSGLFRGIAAASCDGGRGLLRWDDNWVTFLDCMMQLQLLPDASGALVVPTAIQRLGIDVANHAAHLRQYGPDQEMVAAAAVEAAAGAVRAGGVELRGLRANVIARRKPAGDPVLERYDFAPYRLGEEEEEGGAGEETWAEAVRVCAQIALENRGPIARGAPPLSALELLSASAKCSLGRLLLDALSDVPLVQVQLKAFLAKGASTQSAGTDAVFGVDALKEEYDAAFVVGSGLVAEDRLKQVARVLAPAGCVLALEEVEGRGSGEVVDPGLAAGLKLVLRWRRGRHALLLLRKGGWEVDARHATVVHIRQEADEEAGEAFGWLPTLQAALREARLPEQRVLLVAEGQPLAGAQGLFNCLRQEPGPGRDKLRLYVLEEGAVPFSLQSDVYRRQLELDLAVNELRGGRWGCPRHFLLTDDAGTLMESTTNAYCDAAVFGDLSSFKWFEGDVDLHKPNIAPDEELVHVYYAALNFRDIMLASGKLNSATVSSLPGQKCLLGLEVSGRTADGRRVMGVTAACGGIATATACKSYYLWEVPEHWTLEQAATVPSVYFTAIYALMVRGRMRRGDSVLVHAGSGGVGQAAIHLALAQGCRVLATVGTDAKRRFLLRTFPQLSPEDVGNSRDCSFEALVLRRTAGRGVDLVLNSLAGDKLLASLRCLAPGGRFLEIGKFDMEQNTDLKLEKLSKGRSFHGILLDKFWLQAPVEDQKRFAAKFGKLLQEGAIKPLQATVFEKDEVEKAFRFMAGGKHIGKVLVRIRPEEKSVVAAPCPQAIPVRRRFHCQPDRSYAICGGLGGFGLELADWLVSRGCHQLVLTSRRGVADGYQARKMLLWQRKGVRVHIFTGDAATHAGADALLRAANALAPLAAIFNLAVVLRDGLFDNQTVDAFVESYRCKALATRRLDAASRRLCPSLSHFVVFSSVSCGRGNAGQTNYGLANSVMEGVVRGRREDGLPATAVQWGAVGDVGLVADMRDDDRQLEIGGTLQQRLSSCLEVLDDFLSCGNSDTANNAVLSSMVVAEKKAGAGGGDIESLVADIFGIKDLRTVSPESTLADLGLDSMMAVEIQQAVERNFDVTLTVQDLRSLTFAGLRDLQEKQQDSGKKEDGGHAEGRTAVNRKGVWNIEGMIPLAHGLPPPTAAVSLIPMGKGEGAPILLLPGADDHPPLLELLSSRLHRPSYCIHVGNVCDRAPLSQMTDSCMPKIVTRLEAEGLRGTVVLPDSSPNFMKAMLQLEMKVNFEEELCSIFDTQMQNNILVPSLRYVKGLTEKAVKEYMQQNDTFRVVGYCFGGLLALDIAARLEAEGLRGTVVLLDSSPNLMKAILQQEMKVNNEEELCSIFDRQMENNILVPGLRYFEGLTEKEAHKELESCGGDWEKRLQRAVRKAEEMGFFPETLRLMAEKTVARCIMLRDMSWPVDRPPLASSITLLRPMKSPYQVHDYGLSQSCGKQITVHCIDGVDHGTILTSPLTAQIINKTFAEMSEN